MRAWYDIREADLANRADEAGVAESVEQVEALIEREIERGVPVSRIFLAGFSQGGAVILAAGPRRSEPRSEEHTSELQSLMRSSYADFCLKKTNQLSKVAL